LHAQNLAAKAEWRLTQHRLGTQRPRHGHQRHALALAGAAKADDGRHSPGTLAQQAVDDRAFFDRQHALRNGKCPQSPRIPRTETACPCSAQCRV